MNDESNNGESRPGRNRFRGCSALMAGIAVGSASAWFLLFSTILLIVAFVSALVGLFSGILAFVAVKPAHRAKGKFLSLYWVNWPVVVCLFMLFVTPPFLMASQERGWSMRVRASTTLVILSRDQAIFQELGSIDVDGNGVGDYGTLAELSAMSDPPP